ncbi:MAG: amidohydrolase family protein [Candidatus Bathyarchaeia archaeon]
MSVGLRGSYVVGFDGSEHRLIRDGVVIIEGKRIKHVGKSYDGPVYRWIDADGCLIMPGLINTHLHASTAPRDKSFLEDIGIRQLYGSNLGENLTVLNASATKEDLEVYAHYSLNECLLSGNTTVVEIGMIPNLGEELTLKIMGDVGIRGYEGHVIGDGEIERVDRFDFKTRWLKPEVGVERLAKAISFVERFDGAYGGRIKGAIYAGSPLNTSLGLMAKIKEAAGKLNCPVSMHAGEWVLEFQNMIRMYGKTPVEVIEESGLLSKRLIIGHGWAIAGHPLLGYPARDGGDLPKLAASGATVSHDPVVFVKRGNRLHSHSAFLREGVNVSIGTDTAPQDMLNEMRIASYVSKLADWDYSSGTSREIFDSATIRGAKALGKIDIGRLAKGALADITVVDMTTINNVPCRDPIRNIVNSTQRSDVRIVMVDGEVLVENGKLVKDDERRLAKDVQRVSEYIYRRLPDNHPFKKSADEISPPSLKSWEGELI